MRILEVEQGELCKSTFALHFAWKVNPTYNQKQQLSAFQHP